MNNERPSDTPISTPDGGGEVETQAETQAGDPQVAVSLKIDAMSLATNPGSTR